MASETKFQPGGFAVHRQCGVGRIAGVQRESVAGLAFDAFVLEILSRRLTVRVPVARAGAVLRPLASRETAALAMRILSEKPRPLNGGRWDSKMVAAETKLSTGELIAAAEVARDVHARHHMSHTEFEPRVLEWAIGRLADELAAIDGAPRNSVLAKIAGALSGQQAAKAA